MVGNVRCLKTLHCAVRKYISSIRDTYRRRGRSVETVKHATEDKDEAEDKKQRF